MRRLNYFVAAFALLAGAVLLTSMTARAQQEQGFPKSPSFSKPDDAQNCPPKLPGPVIMQLGPPPNLYSPAADFKSRVGAPAFAVVGDQGGTATPSVAAAPFAAMPFAAAPGTCNDCGCSACPQFSTGPIGAAPIYQPPMQNYSIPTPFYFPTPALQPTIPPAPTIYTAAVNPPAAHVYFPTASAPTPMPAIYAPAAPSYYPPAPSANVAYGKAYSSPAAGEADRLEHMLEAVHQLEAAGMQADADQLRRKCDSSMKVVLNSLKSAGANVPVASCAAPSCPCDPCSCADVQSGCESKCECGTCGQMAAAAGLIPQAFPCYDADSGQIVMKNVGIACGAAPSACDCPTAGAFDCSSTGACNCPTACAAANPSAEKQVVVSMQMLELNRTKCEEEGIELSDNVADLIDRLDSLKKQGVLEVVSRPKVMTNSGMTAYLELGRRIPLDEQIDTAAGETEPQFGESKTVSTKFEVRPTIQADNKIRLQLHCHVNSYNVGSAAQADGLIAPAIEGHDIQTMLHLPSGETGLLAVATKKRNESRIVEYAVCKELPDGTKAQQLIKEEVNAPCEIQLLVLVRPEIVGAKDSAKILSSNEDGWPRSEAAKLAWRPVRDSLADAQLQSGGTQAERRHTSTLDNPFEDEVTPTHVELSGFFKEESLFEDDHPTNGTSFGGPSGLNLLEIQRQKLNEPFPSSTKINFQQVPTPPRYEIDPATLYNINPDPQSKDPNNFSFFIDYAR